MMMPPRMSANYPIKQLRQWLNFLRDAVAAGVVSGDGQTVKTSRTPGGTTLSAMRMGGGKGGSSGSIIAIAKTTSRIGARTYAVDIYSRWESDWTLNTTYRTATGDSMQTPGLNDTAAADQLPTGTSLPVTRQNINGTAVWVPTYPVGLL